MISKRASKKVAHLGIEIQKCTFGYYPSSVPNKNETSKVFKSARGAVDAVIGGYRPTDKKVVTP